MKAVHILIAALCLATVSGVLSAKTVTYTFDVLDIECHGEDAPAPKIYALRNVLGASAKLSLSPGTLFSSDKLSLSGHERNVKMKVKCEKDKMTCSNKEDNKKVTTKVDENTVRVEASLIFPEDSKYDDCIIKASASRGDRSAEVVVNTLVGHGDYSIMKDEKVNTMCSDESLKEPYTSKVTELFESEDYPSSASIVRDVSGIPGKVTIVRDGNKIYDECTISHSDGEENASCKTVDNKTLFSVSVDKNAYVATTLTMQPPVEGFDGCAVMATLEQMTPDMDKIEGDYSISEDLSKCRVGSNGDHMTRTFLEKCISDKSLPEKLAAKIVKGDGETYSVMIATGENEFQSKRDCAFSDKENPNTCYYESDQPIFYINAKNVVELVEPSQQSHEQQEFEGCTVMATRDGSHDDDDDGSHHDGGNGGKGGFPKWAWIVIGLGTGMVVIGVAVGLFIYNRQQKSKKDMDYSKLQVDSQA